MKMEVDGFIFKNGEYLIPYVDENKFSREEKRMEIIKLGQIPEDKKRFECKNCGTIFNADINECKRLDHFAYIHDDIQWECVCPLCRKKVYI